MSNWISAVPSPHLLQSIANDRLTFRETFGEMIDNSIDANARRITIEIEGGKRGVPAWITFSDDGEGAKNLIDMVQLGKHTDHKTSLLGRFGVGAKNAMLWLGGINSEVTITTIRDGARRELTLNWKEYANGNSTQGAWMINPNWVSESPANPGERGTTVTIRPCERRLPDGPVRASLLSDLGYLYSAAIKKGVQIQIREGKKPPTILSRWEFPKFSELIDTVVSVDGRGARVHVGVVADGQKNPKLGITYTHGFRVIIKNSGFGCGDLDFSNICGFVELDDKWTLTKNKDDVSQHKDELGEAVFAVIRPLLERAAARGQEVEFAAFTNEVEESANAMLRGGNPDAKAKRGQGDSEGSVKPANTGRRHRRAAVEQDGSTFVSGHNQGAAARPGKLRVTFAAQGDAGLLGQYSVNQAALNLDHPLIARLRKEKNADAIVFVVALLIADSLKSEAANGQLKMRFAVSGNIASDVGKLLAQPVLMNGLPEAAE